MAYLTWRFLSFSNNKSLKKHDPEWQGRMTRSQASHGFLLCHPQQVVFTLWFSVAAGALSIMSESQAGGRAKGCVSPSILHCLALTSHWSGLPHSYVDRKASEILIGRSVGKGVIEYWELPVSLCLLDFCLDAFPFLFFFLLPRTY